MLLFFDQIRPGVFRPKATATNSMHNNDVEACDKRVVILAQLRSLILTRFLRIFDVVILAYLNVISIVVYTVRCIICIYFI